MFLTPLVFVAALTLEVLGSYMSVVGLSSKSSLILIVLAIALDFSKIVIASVLYKNWKSLNIALRAFLLPTTIFLVVITSYGAYAYLLQEFGKTTSNGQQIATKLSLLEEEAVQVKTRKKEIDAQIAAIDPMFVTQKRRLNTMFAKELEYLNERSIQLDKEIPQLKSSQMTDTLGSGTLGSLSKAWGTTPDQTAKIIALMMVIVIDPLAIVMLIVGNFLILQREEKKKLEAVEKALVNASVPAVVEPFFNSKVDSAVDSEVIEEIVVQQKEEVVSNQELTSSVKIIEEEDEVVNNKEVIKTNLEDLSLLEAVWIDKHFVNIQMDFNEKELSESFFKFDNDDVELSVFKKYEFVINDVQEDSVLANFWEDYITKKYGVDYTDFSGDEVLKKVVFNNVIEEVQKHIKKEDEIIHSFENNVLFNETLIANEEIIDNEDKTSQEYWIDKYGTTKEEMEALERPGDYIIDAPDEVKSLTSN